MTIEQIIDILQRDRNFMSCVSNWETLKPKDATFAEFPEALDDRTVSALKKHGIKKLYSHQYLSIKKSLEGQNTTIVTPTASGKTLCFNVPVLDTIVKTKQARALYLFPTKALSQDQLNELHGVIDNLSENLDFSIKSYTFDGDTPQSARKSIRTSGHIVVTNPDMLHSGILPHHTLWIKLFENLQFIIIDEIHHYKGVFGSHLANVIRRLKRICKFYGSNPQFITCSATISNPKELAEQLTGEPCSLIDINGAPRGEKHIIYYNPPVVNKELGIRRSYIKETKSLAAKFIKNAIQTIVFVRSRMSVEILLTYLKDEIRYAKMSPKLVRGYRGGYLPLERRAIEKGLRDGHILGVVSTNALELGIDIGQLQVCIMASYPGTVSSTLQQAGRAGRRIGSSIAILVASSAPLDQYILNNPQYLYDKSPEACIIDPDNLLILLSHIKCAAFELPFETDERFGSNFQGQKGIDSTQEILEYLAENKIIHLAADRWHWMAETYPAENVSLRSAAEENIVIVDKTYTDEKVIGEIDLFAAQLMVHDEAIYIHEGQQFYVDNLDWERRKAYVHSVQVDHYTDAQLKADLKVLEVFDSDDAGGNSFGYGDVRVSSLVTMYKKVKFNSHENVGFGKIALPELELQTASFWFLFEENVHDNLSIDKDALGEGLKGAANVLKNIIPLFVMCDPRDISSLPMVRTPLWKKPGVFVWEKYPGGVGYSKKVYQIYKDIAQAAKKLVKDCSCETGCPSCIGPTLEVGKNGKETTIKLLDLMSK